MPTISTITPCLWFDHQGEAAAKFYTSIFKNSKITQITRYTESGQEFHGYKSLVLDNVTQDPSMMREMLANNVFESVGIPYSQIAPCRLTVNNGFWGLYTLIEAVSKPFLKASRVLSLGSVLSRWTRSRRSSMASSRNAGSSTQPGRSFFLAPGRSSSARSSASRRGRP